MIQMCRCVTINAPMRKESDLHLHLESQCVKSTPTATITATHLYLQLPGVGVAGSIHRIVTTSISIDTVGISPVLLQLSEVLDDLLKHFLVYGVLGGISGLQEEGSVWRGCVK